MCELAEGTAVQRALLDMGVGGRWVALTAYTGLRKAHELAYVHT
jgi:hypothetical protein